MAEEKVFLNGEMVPLSRALIPFDDRALLFGDSAFETVRAYGGYPFRLWRHIERLAESCRLLRLAVPLSAKEITAAVAALLADNRLDRDGDARIRITVTGGPSSGPRGLERPGPTGMFITARPYKPPGESDYGRGVTLAVSGLKRNSSSPLSSAKSGNYLDSMLARQDALDRGSDDAVMLTTAGNLSEATSSNIFLAKDGELMTPDVGCGFLPGVTREAVIELCGELRVPCKAIMKGLDTLLGADEVFLTNSMFELMPACRVGTRELPSCPGPITHKLTNAYRDLVARETK